MRLSDIEAEAQAQDRGRDFDLLDPVTGKALGMSLRIVGPDSATQRRARLRFADALSEARTPAGIVPAHLAEAARLEMLAGCVVGWDITEDGEAVPFTQANVLRLLRAGHWIQEQVDGFASDRAAFRKGSQ